MAKTNMVARSDKVKKLVNKTGRTVRADIRKRIKKADVNGLSFEEKMQLVTDLANRPRKESYVRIRNRCRVCGRPRGTLRKFGLCRIHLREAFVRGDVPGLVKSSW